MLVPSWKVAAVPFAVAAVALPLACAGPVSPDAVSASVPVNAACGELATGNFSTLPLGASPTAENMRLLLAQSNALPKSVPLQEKGLIDACVELGRAAGIGEVDLQAAPDSGRGAEKVCSVAATKVAAMLRKAKDTKILLDVRIEATPCFVDATGARKCLTDCGASARGDMRAECVGGQLIGTCQGRCAGKCTFPAGPGGGACNAVCSGRCDQGFRGTCGGTCSGACDGTPLKAPGGCGGICDGSCNDRALGACAGRCDGQCDGTWERSVPSGNCTGICMGGCAGEVANPLCTGDYAPPGVDAVCQAACGAAATLGARCDLPIVHVVIREGRPGPELVKLLYGIQSAVPKILRQQAAAKRLTRALQSAMSASTEWSGANAVVGQRSFVCIRAGVDAMKEALAAFDLVSRSTEAVASAIKTDPAP